MDYRLDAYNAADEVIKAAKLEEGDLLVEREQVMIMN